MKTNAGIYVQFRSFLTLTLDGGEWSVSRPVLFLPGERGYGAH